MTSCLVCVSEVAVSWTYHSDAVCYHNTSQFCLSAILVSQVIKSHLNVNLDLHTHVSLDKSTTRPHQKCWGHPHSSTAKCHPRRMEKSNVDQLENKVTST